MTYLSKMKSGVFVGVVVLSIAAYFAYQSRDIALGELKLANKRVVVCGASTGIGEQTALLYASQNARV